MQNRKTILFVTTPHLFEVFVPVMYPAGAFIEEGRYITNDFEVVHRELYDETMGLRCTSIVVILSDSSVCVTSKFTDYVAQQLMTRLLPGCTTNIVVI